MKNVFDTIIINRHLLIDDGRGMMLIDSGSPVSFHKERVINIASETYPVADAYREVTTDYLSKKVGCPIVGLIGMDIMINYTVWINTQNFGSFISFEKEGISSFHDVNTFNMMGAPGLYLTINGRRAKMLFDTGAHVSYIRDNFHTDKPSTRTTKDFSPFFQRDHLVNVYELPTTLADKTVDLEYGRMPSELSLLVNQLNVDGFIGFDLIDKFRIVIDKGIIKLPPQGI